MDTPPSAGTDLLLNWNLKTRADRAHLRSITLLCLVVALALFQYFVEPLVFPAHAAGACVVVLLCIISTPLHWGLMHESIHGNLFVGQAENRRAGRFLGWFLCLSWDVMRFGHLLHHSHNRHEFDRPEAVPPGGSRLRVAGPYYFKLLGGHALISAGSSVALALPFSLSRRLMPEVEPLATAATRAFARPGRGMRIRSDICATVVLVACACICWRAQWPVFAATIGARFVVLSILDNAPHYGTALDSGAYARNTRLPRIAEWLVMGHNFHGIHHAATGLKWHELRSAFARAGVVYEDRWTRMVLRQFQGPVYLD